MKLGAGRRKVGIKDVAALAQVHYSTASRALDPLRCGRLSIALVARVREAAAELQYRQNKIAAGLRTNQTHTIGILVPDLLNPIFPSLLQGIEECARQSGYSVLLANAGADSGRELSALDGFLAQQVDGLILATTRLDDPVVRIARASGLSVVSVICSADDERVSSFIPARADAFLAVVDHLHGLGHRRIACMSGPLDTSAGVAQVAAFRKAITNSELPSPDCPIVIAEEFSIAAGTQSMHDLLAIAEPPTAVVTGSDLLAFGCLDACAKQGLSCPEDISITGFNDMPFLDRCTPALTTVRVPYQQIGHEATTHLLSLRSDARETGFTREFPTELVVRGSTAPPRERRSGESVR
jgi:LacI family transcriptional regulator